MGSLHSSLVIQFLAASSPQVQMNFSGFISVSVNRVQTSLAHTFQRCDMKSLLSKLLRLAVLGLATFDYLTFALVCEIGIDTSWMTLHLFNNHLTGWSSSQSSLRCRFQKFTCPHLCLALMEGLRSKKND
ncbi:unnamed protein product [Protopolystoma xenopodis]|uniref:Uncharacterized protein n=1 Tax=Protopolystoma xenopodis TaxID=117903 RepID=A0A3S5AMW7_9PLAT|nr:unnamed protein product [Protopolystoma xenopodis]